MAQQTLEDFNALQSLIDSYSGESGNLNGVTVDPSLGLQQQYGNLLSTIQGGIGTLGDEQFAQTSKSANQYADLYDQLRDKYSGAELDDALSQFQTMAPQYQQQMQDMISQNRQQDLNDVNAMAGDVRSANDAAVNPQVMAMRQQMMDQAQNDLSAGAQLTPDQMRNANQMARSSLGSRGISQGTSGASREAMANLLQGENLRSSRQNFAQGVIDSETSKQADPFSIVLGNTNQAASGAGNIYNQAAFAPSTEGIPDFFGQAYNLGSMAQNQQGIDDANRQYQISSGLGISNADQYGIDTTGLAGLV